MERLRGDASVVLQDLNQAQAQINKCFGALRSNLDHVATQVRTNMARQSESLRMREAWLLKQLELVYADKTEVLTRQRDRLLEASETLKGCMQNPSCSENQLVDCLDSLSSINLLPEETPFISFRVDSALLREVISQYGRVVPGYSGHFADPARPSACLPRSFEEEDEEGSSVQMSHKPLQSSGTVRVPHMGYGRAFVRAWLSQQQPVPHPVKTGTSNSLTKTDGTESFEILSPFGQSPSQPSIFPGQENKEEWLCKDRSMDTSANSLWQAVFSDVSSQPTKLWLNNSSTSASQTLRTENWVKHVPIEDDEGSEFVDMEKDVDHAAIVAGVCANPLSGGDPCKTFDDCCCDESCINRLLEKPAPTGGKVNRMLSEWLMSKDGRPVLSHEVSMKEVSDDMSDKMDDDERSVHNPDSKEYWLKDFQPAANEDSHCITSSNFKFQHVDEDMGKWLIRSSSESSIVNKSNSVRKSSQDEQWLLSYFRKKMNFVEEEPSEVKWLQ